MADSSVDAITWIIAINGQSKEITAPAQVFIGRKPLRPVEVPEGALRFDVPDETKSMSKNHAKLDIHADGEAALSDLNSTNGTYIFNSADVLLRVPAENPFTIVDGAVSGQFGDVKYEISLRDASDENPDDTDETKVPNLFDLQATASEDAPARSMSVDDILDLRAGEPTSVFAMQKPIEQSATIREDVQAFAGEAGEADSEPDEVIEPHEEVAEEVAQDLAEEALEVSNSAHEGEVKADVIETEVVDTPSDDLDENSQPDHVDTAVTQMAALNEDSGFMPVYEAGSVFDRLSRGEFDHRESVIEAGGHTSIEAKTTQDFNVQFEIARIPELLPFLGLNPFLYDDMYAWLVAQNNEQINNALETNEGYAAWKASSK